MNLTLTTRMGPNVDSREEGYDPYNSARRVDNRFALKIRENVRYGRTAVCDWQVSANEIVRKLTPRELEAAQLLGRELLARIARENPSI
jgi:hypothetical protein